ncbi:MAG: shikimate dehydrogenase [Sedimentisphaerales bacterium]|nr:shikimate dehydrogenase [Sedimentisphaerales bacterium]
MLREMTYLTVPIKVSRLNDSLDEIGRAKGAGAEAVELRLDYARGKLADGEIQTLIGSARRLGLMVLATCRPEWEGGSFKGPEQQRLEILRQAAAGGADFVDVELACFEREDFDIQHLTGADLAKSGIQKAKLLLSSHDFNAKPVDIAERLDRMAGFGADVRKIAYQADSIEDSFEALDVLREFSAAGQAVVALAMGPAGVITRILAKKLGAFLTFASLVPDSETAPGQLTVEQMKGVFRWDEVGCDTKVFGVIGYPVAHSMSPALHNGSFLQVNYNGLYLPMLVEPPRQRFQDFVDGMRQRQWLNLRGLSVTIPHKHNALEYVRDHGGQLEPLAEKIGAVNTLLFEGDQVSGFNTDYAGSLDAITNTLGISRYELKGMSAAVVGAGGAARALVAGLTDVGAQVTIYNRTVEKAQVLGQEFNCQWKPLEQLRQMDCELLVNATSIGMHPIVDASPVPAECLKKGMAVFDTVYNPWQTRLLCDAEAVGATVIDGVAMFVNQAAAQFEMFTQQRAPLALMRKIVESQLG